MDSITSSLSERHTKEQVKNGVIVLQGVDYHVLDGGFGVVCLELEIEGSLVEFSLPFRNDNVIPKDTKLANKNPSGIKTNVALPKILFRATETDMWHTQRKEHAQVGKICPSSHGPHKSILHEDAHPKMKIQAERREPDFLNPL